ncbi:MAG: AMP-binding protein [Solirubrobacteraceae bacterium]
MEAWLARAARMYGGRVALSTRDGARHTYAELYARARAVAGGLRDRGIGAGDRVALAMPSEELVVALHGCLLISAAALPVDLRLTADEQTARTATAALVLDRLVDGEPVDPAPAPAVQTATVMFTSGTTAGPKEVALSHDNWLWNALGSSLALGLDRDERWLCPMPLAHVGGLSIQIRSAIYGTEVLLHERFDTAAALAVLMDRGERVTLVSLVPTMLVRLLEAGLREPPTLRWALLGGGPIAPALLQRAQAAGVPVAPSYGMTEACSQIATSGWPLLGTELTLGPDGEVLVRGRTVAAGALAPDGWLHTGDRGAFDADGRLLIEGRLADTIITGGENVSPVEVEAVLLEHPEIRDVAVLGHRDPEWGEVVVAQVVLRDPAAAVPEAALRAHCAARLAPFKVPKRFEPVAAVPRGVTGKLLRRELR